MNTGELIYNLAKSKSKIYNLEREIEELKSELKSTKLQLSEYNILTTNN